MSTNILHRTQNPIRPAIVAQALPNWIRGDGDPNNTMARKPRLKNGPSSRSFAADAHGCIMVRILTRSAAYKVAARRHVPYSELPSDRFDRR